MTPVKSMRAAVIPALVLAAWLLPSCRDVPAPEGGVQSIAPLEFPSPGLVAGDTMRDSAGTIAPLTLVAFDANGDTVADPNASFVVLDTGAHLAGDFLIGDTPGVTVRVVGTADGLQTLPASVKVTLTPDTLVATDSGVFNVTYSIANADTMANSPALSALVRHLAATPSGVESVIVYYAIERAPASNGHGPSIVLLNGSTPSTRDTSDASGAVSRTARLRIAALDTFATDTADVSATASYRGRSLGTVRFRIIYTNATPLP